MTPPNLIELKAAFARNENITRALRKSPDATTNEQSAILIAYDFQAGSYIRALNDPAQRAIEQRYAEAIAQVLRPLRPQFLLEAGVGEATTFREVLRRISLPARSAALGFDLSWSRIHVGKRYLGEDGPGPALFVGELEAIPLAEGAADIVYTSHAIEPNHGREGQILDELYRVAGRYLLLCEPGYELASEEARARMELLGYCRGLREWAVERGWKVVEHRLLGDFNNAHNPTAMLLIEKPVRAAAPPEFVCPNCRGPLARTDEALFCAAEGLAFPFLRGIPCLARHDAILAGRYLD